MICKYKIIVPLLSNLIFLQPFPIFSDIQTRIPWNQLEKYHRTLTLEEFKNLVDRVYSPTGELYQYLNLTPNYIDIFRDKGKSKPALFRLYLARSPETKMKLHSHFERLRKLKGTISSTHPKPLTGLRILLDPGHIGGAYSHIEEREFSDGKRPPIREAELNLNVAQRLKERLQGLGASVYSTKEELEPVTNSKPDDFEKEARKKFLANKTSPHDRPYEPQEQERIRIRKEKEKLFYRTAEIEARADVAKRIKPDFTLCIHFNAAPATPQNPWTQDNRLVLFTHGSYEPKELAEEEQRFKLIAKLLENSHAVELDLATAIAKEMALQTGLPPVEYGTSTQYIQIGPTPYTYARNLAANRLFPGPVIYLEPYYQNNPLVYERALAGDYEEEKEIQGKKYKSLSREYADSVVDGVLGYVAEEDVKLP